MAALWPEGGDRLVNSRNPEPLSVSCGKWRPDRGCIGGAFFRPSFFFRTIVRPKVAFLNLIKPTKGFFVFVFVDGLSGFFVFLGRGQGLFLVRLAGFSPTNQVYTALETIAANLCWLPPLVGWLHERREKRASNA